MAFQICGSLGCETKGRGSSVCGIGMFGNDIRVLCRKCAYFSVITSHRPNFPHSVAFSSSFSFLINFIHLSCLMPHKLCNFVVYLRVIRYGSDATEEMGEWLLHCGHLTVPVLSYFTTWCSSEVAYESHLCLSLRQASLQIRNLVLLHRQSLVIKCCEPRTTHNRSGDFRRFSFL